MAKCDAVIPLMAAMKRRGDAIHIAAETIKKMYDLNIPELVAQVRVAGACFHSVDINDSPAREIMKHVQLLLAHWRTIYTLTPLHTHGVFRKDFRMYCRSAKFHC